MVKKKKVIKRKGIVIKTREGRIVAFTKVGPGKFAFVMSKTGKGRFIGKGRFKTQNGLKKKFAGLVKKQIK